MNKFFLGICFVSFLSSCVGNKFVTSTSSKSAIEVLSRSSQKAAQLDWFTSQLKGQAQFNTKNYPVNAQLRMKKDSVIWISISAILGLEALRVQLTPDSVKLINRLSSSYFIGDMSALAQRYNIPLSYQEIQDALLGVYKPKKHLNFKLENTKPDYLILAESENMNHLVRLNANYLPLEIMRSRSDSQLVKLLYSEFMELDSQWLPKDLNVEALSNQNTIKLSLSYSKMMINRPKKIKFSIPSSYAPM